MKTSTLAWVIAVLIILAGAGWYVYANTQSAAAPTTSTVTTTTQNPSTTPATNTPVLQTVTSGSLGTYLAAASSGMTLYTYSPDTPGVSTCTGQCAVNWPPYIVDATAGLTAASGINGALGTTVRGDGSTQLTYNGAPLYTYIKDTKPGDTVGQGVGGTWFVVHP